MAGTSKYKALYEEEKEERERFQRLADERGGDLLRVEGIVFGPKREGRFGEREQERDVIVGVRRMQESLSSLSAKATTQATELARAWHMIRVFSGDRTLSQETQGLMEALKSGKLHDYASVFSPQK